MKYLAIVLVLILVFSACQYLPQRVSETSEEFEEEPIQVVIGQNGNPLPVETPESLSNSCLAYANLVIPNRLKLQAIDPNLNYFAIPGYYGNPAPESLEQLYRDNVPMRSDFTTPNDEYDIFKNIGANKYQNRLTYDGYVLHNERFRKFTFTYDIVVSLTDDAEYLNIGTCAYKTSNEKYGCFVGYIGEFVVVDYNIDTCELDAKLPKDTSYGDAVNILFDRLRPDNNLAFDSYFQIAGLEQWFYNQRDDYEDSRWEGIKTINGNPTFVSSYQVDNIINSELRKCRTMYLDLITGLGRLEEDFCSKHYDLKMYDRFGQVS